MSRKTPRHVHGSLRENAYNTLLSAIIFSDIAPGSSIDEKQLSQQFGLGIAAVRDALLRLGLENMVERRARIGTLIPPLGLREVQDVFEARILIEGECAALAAERASSEEIARLRAAFDGYKATINKRDFRALVEMDQVFHRTLAAATRNQHLEHQLIVLHNNASRFWYFGIQRLNQKTLVSDIDAHLAVTDAIEARDTASAKRRMQDLLGQFPENVSGLLIAPTILERRRISRPGVPQAKRVLRRRGAATA